MKQRTKTLLSSLLFSIYFLLQMPLIAFAEEVGIDTTPVTNGMASIAVTLQKFGTPIFIIMCIICGLALMSGQQGRGWAKGTFIFAVIGFGVCLFAQPIAAMLEGTFGLSI